MACQGRQLKFGRDYIIPSPFDPRLIWFVPPFVAQAAMRSGVARRPIADMNAYRAQLRRRLDPSAGFLQTITDAVRSAPGKRVVFAEGEEPSVIRAAYAFSSQGLGVPVLLGRENLIRANAEDLKVVKAMGLSETGILTSVSDYHIFLKLGQKSGQGFYTWDQGARR